jgi:eukaryotic-like serine/threonine-protein kinase
MPLKAGTRIGSHEIVGFVGAGGMGEVYRAHDSTLGRDVAIKVLSDEWLGDPDRLSRFDREARVLASLNHPHIGAIYSIEEAQPSTGQAGGRALVLELVEGLTLAEHLKLRAAAKGPKLGLHEALIVARQVADALEAAHEKGIIHRDLKPANIKITPEGVVKVLDFGLATYAARLRAGFGALGGSHIQTVAMGNTVEGLVVGTAAYMSPEQARGQVVDKRTDIWAFGCLLYEMLTGRPPFLGDTITDTIAVVLEREPNWASFPIDAPVAVRRLIERCLAKDPKRRLRDIGDARLEIDAALDSPAEIETKGPGRGGWTARHWIAALIVTAVATGLAVWSQTPRSSAVEPSPGVVARLVILPPPGQPLAVDLDVAAISPDGRRVAYVAGRGNGQRIYVREIDQFSSTPLAGTEGANTPFFSPDSQWVGFFAGGD